MFRNDKSNKFNDISVNRVFLIAAPLMLGKLIWAISYTMNRVFLSFYDLEVMNAVILASTILFVFEYFFTSIAITTEIFAGQFNGSKKFHKTPSATWQMLFFALILIPIKIFIGIFLTKYIIPSNYYDLASDYFIIIISFMGLNSGREAINGFFIGIKKTKIIFLNTLFAHIFAVISSYFLIFGYKDFIPSMGAKGAAISVVLSYIQQFVVILAIFLSDKYNKKYKTRILKFKFDIFSRLLNLGLPNGVAIFAEIGSSFIVQVLILTYSPINIKSFNIAMNAFLMIYFITYGLQKTVGSLAANIIGEEINIKKLLELIKNSVIILIIFIIFISIDYAFFGKGFLQFYTNDPIVEEHAFQLLPLVIITMFFDGIGLIFNGVTIGGGDTKFAMIANILINIFFKIVPVYIFLSLGIFEYHSAWIINIVMSVLYALVFFLRYNSYKWLKLKLS